MARWSVHQRNAICTEFHKNMSIFVISVSVAEINRRTHRHTVRNRPYLHWVKCGSWWKHRLWKEFLTAFRLARPVTCLMHRDRSASNIHDTVLCRRRRNTRRNICPPGRDSSVGIALGYGLDDLGSRVRFPAVAGNYFLHHRLQNGSGAHQAFYLMGTRGSFPGGKAAGAWS
jgi:hypothetical protein